MIDRIGLDLGRHRAYCATASASAAAGSDTAPAPSELLALSNDDPGRWLRWRDRQSERITDRIQRLAGGHQSAAVETVAVAVEGLFPELGEGATWSTPPTVVVPVGFGPAGRQAVLDGFGGESHASLIDRPVATFAHWLSTTPAAHDLTDVVYVLDNDLGQLSVLAVDFTEKRLLLARPLSASADDDPAVVRERLADVAADVARLTDQQQDADPTTPWRGRPTTGVVFTGSDRGHPTTTELARSVLGPAPVEIGGDLTAAALGAASAGVLDDWQAMWPTITVSVDDESAVTPGPNPVRDLPLESSARRLSFRVGGAQAMLFSGSVLGLAISLPADLGDGRRIRLLDDGRVIVLGDEGRRPLSFRAKWPAAATAAGPRPSIEVRPIGRRPLMFPEPIVATPPSDAIFNPRPSTGGDLAPPID